MNQILVARDRDVDLIPSNVRAGVTIYDTLGTYSGGFGSLGIGQSKMLTPTIRTLPQYAIEASVNLITTLQTNLTAFVLLGNILCVGVGYDYTSGPIGPSHTAFYNIDMTTGEITAIGTAVMTSGVGNAFDSIKYENGKIYWNWNNATGGYNNSNFEIDIVAGTITSNDGGGYHTTGVTPEDTSIVVGGKTFEIYPLTYGWTGILVS